MNEVNQRSSLFVRRQEAIIASTIKESEQTIMVTTQDEVREWIRDLTHLCHSEKPLSLLRCLEVAAKRQSSASFRDILAGVSYMVAGGFTLSSALAIYGDVFDQNLLTVIRYGELYGEMEETLQRYVNETGSQTESTQSVS